MQDKDQILITANAEPVSLGSMLFTIVEPHRGHEVEYNRWYERDHLYSGCMIGPYNFAARRFVATWDLKGLRNQNAAKICGKSTTGSYLAMYWILKDYGHIWGKWAGKQVMALHQAGRMFEHREHVHTQLYDYLFEVGDPTVAVPAELALDHPFSSVMVEFFDKNPAVDQEDYEAGLSEMARTRLVELGNTANSLVFSPQAMKGSAPGVPAGSSNLDRYLVITFSNVTPYEICNDSKLGKSNDIIDTDSPARLFFIPTIPGTDCYSDQLWS